MSRKSPVSLLLLSFVLLALTSGVVVAQDEEVGGPALTTFLPEPDAVFIQKVQGSDAGNVRIVVQLSASDVEQLKAVTGRTDFAAIGGCCGEMVLRDDGVEPDDQGGDRLFSSFASVDDADLAERAEADRTTTGGRGTFSVKTFNGRQANKKSKTVTVFDLDGFLAGALVPFAPAVTAVDSTTSTPSTPSEVLGRVSAGDDLEQATAAVITPGTNTFQERVLIIRDPTVVTDPTRTFNACNNTGNPVGVWTFGHLMTEMANQAASGINPSDFVEQWLNHWGAVQTVNTFGANPRAAMASLINDWRAASGGGDLDLTIAPFRLLAILPRVDLRHSVGGTGGYFGASTGKFLDAGEMRFVFGVLLPPGYSQAGFFQPTIVPLGGGCRALAFSVIFEYGVPKCECEDVRDWARAWKALASLPFPSATYNARLERLTQQIVTRNANPLKGNGSALNQLRTNEIALQAPWELREFRIRTIPFDFLSQTTSADSPNNTPIGSPTDFNNTVTFSNYTLSGIRPVPLLFAGNPFLANNPQVTNPGFTWNGPAPLTANTSVAHSDLRHGVGLAACNGCHARETNTIFVHVDPATPGLPANISGFMTGVAVNDPIYVGVGAPIVREFDDLERREIDINAVAAMKCVKHRRINLPHVIGTLAETGRLPFDLFEGIGPVPVAEQPSIALDQLLLPTVAQTH